MYLKDKLKYNFQGVRKNGIYFFLNKKIYILIPKSINYFPESVDLCS